MELYHLAKIRSVGQWTISKTAEYFDCSIGLVSENLRIAAYSHTHESILNCESRQEALKKLGNNGGKNGTFRPSSEEL